MQTQISGGFVAGIVIASVLALIALVVMLAGGLWWWSESGNQSRYSDRGMAIGTTVAGFVALLVVAGGTLLTMYPYDMEYHQYRKVSGTVAQVQSRMLSDGGHSMNQNYAVKLTDNNVYRCDDTRCSLLKPGDTVNLWCIREHQHASVDGYRCNYGGDQ